MNIGFIGLGLMGIPMTRRLLAAGFPVCVWNRTACKADPLVAAGARVMPSVAELVAATDVVILCVSDTAAVEQLVLSANGIADCGRPDQLLIDCSSIDPATTRTLAAELAARCGMGWVDAPVSGGVAGAETGTLAIMAGGTEEQVNRARAVLAPLSQRVTHMGPVGSGQVTKVVNQMLVSCNLLVMAESFAMAEQAGVDASRLPQAMQGGFADSLPLQITGPRMADRDFDPARWHVRTLLKDLELARSLAASMQSSIPMASLGAELMGRHADNGFAERDPATLLSMYLEAAVESER